MLIAITKINRIT